MKRTLNNLWFAATAQPGRIAPTSGSGLGWPIAYIALVGALLNWDMPLLLLIPIVGATASIWRPGPTEARDHERMLIASIGATLPAAAFTVLGASMLFVSILIVLGSSTLVRLVLNDMLSPRMRLRASCFSPDADDLRRLRARPQGPVFVEMGPPIGSLRGIDIPAWFRDDQGRVHEFVTSHTQPTPPTLSDDESFVAPGLVYRMVREKGGEPQS